MDPTKNTQSLEFLSATATNTKSIPGLDLVGSDKIPTSVPSNIPQGSTLFAYNQDVTKPLHTSDDKPFNFPTPQSNNYNYNDQQQNQYSSFQLSRPPPSLPNQFQKNYPNAGDSYSPPADRGRQFDDKFSRPANSQFDNYRQIPDSYQRNEPPRERELKFNSNFTAPNFNTDKYAKYLEDEYDDSRFRDPDPSENEKFNNFGRDDRNHFGQNFRGRGGFQNNKFNDFNRDFNDSPNNRKEMGRGFRGRQDGRPQFGDRSKPDNQNSFNNRFGKAPFGRGAPNDNAPRSNFNWQNDDQQPERFDNAEPQKIVSVEIPLNITATSTNPRIFQEPSKPISLLDLPLMKPPDMFDSK